MWVGSHDFPSFEEILSIFIVWSIRATDECRRWHSLFPFLLPLASISLSRHAVGLTPSSLYRDYCWLFPVHLLRLLCGPWCSLLHYIFSSSGVNWQQWSRHEALSVARRIRLTCCSDLGKLIMITFEREKLWGPLHFSTVKTARVNLIIRQYPVIFM